MKIVGALPVVGLLFLALCVKGAETNVVYFTNRFVTFTNLQGATFDHVQLIRLDASTITYRQTNGGGRVFLTNLAPATLIRLGLETNLIAEATRLDREVAEQRALSEAEERARMREPANWRDVHVRAIFRWWSDRLECQISEMSRHVLIHRPPPELIEYFDQRARLIAGISAWEAERQKAINQIQPYTAQISAFEAQIKQRQYEIDIADANTPVSATGDQLYVEAVMRRRAEVNTAQVNLNVEKGRLEAMHSRLATMEKEATGLVEKMDGLTKQLRDLDVEGVKATTVRVFVTSKQYYGFTNLESSTE